MLSPPAGLPEGGLASALSREWGMTVASMTYQAVGFGSHHWRAADTAGAEWFVTVDELEAKRHSLDEPLTAVFARLRASLAAASDLRECGLAFVLAPVATLDGQPLARINDRFSVAVYPFVSGQSFAWGEYSGRAHRRAVLGLVISVHTAPGAARRHAMADDFTIPHRDELEAALTPAGGAGECGPYARRAASLLAGNAAPVRGLLARYDALASAGQRPSRAVLTHGEPHPGNTMLAAGGWLLIDWDTVLVAPPERDLWQIDPGDGSILRAYAAATGVTPLPAMLELYRIRWDLTDLAAFVSRFRNPHTGNSDDEKSWRILRSLVAGIRA